MPMKIILAAIVSVALSAMSAHTSVAIKDYAFQKQVITVPAGTTVSWTNSDDDPHTVTADDKSFDSKGLGNGDSWTHTFTKPGKYTYHCSAHPFMKGTIIVTEAPKHQ
jgi:plastocyanin